MQDRKRHDEQDKFSEITKAILGCCFDVINTLGSGFVESVYRNALVIALNDNGKESWNTEEYIILHIMPPAIMQILFLFEN